MRAGYEKLTGDPRLSGLSKLSRGCACACACVCVCAVGDVDIIASEVLTFAGSPVFAAPNQVPPALLAFCDAVLTGAVTMPRLLGFCLAWAACMLTLCGIAGTGGAISSEWYEFLGNPPLLRDLCLCAPGDGDRNVRSVMDPELLCLLSCAPGRTEVSGVLLPAEGDRDALFRVFLFVWTSATLVGVVGRALRAAAAAAALSEAVLDWRRVNAEMAAVAALGFAVEALRGCEEKEGVELARDAWLWMAMAAKAYLDQTGVGREHCPARPIVDGEGMSQDTGWGGSSMQADVDMYFYSQEVIPAVYDKSTKRWNVRQRRNGGDHSTYRIGWATSSRPEHGFSLLRYRVQPCIVWYCIVACA